MTLQRLVLTYTREGVEARVLYRTTSGAGPSTKARRREVTTLVRTGLQRALEALDADDVADLGTSGYEIREDVIGLSTASPDTQRPMREGDVVPGPG